jgi:long-subunit fatty acid transport protein
MGVDRDSTHAFDLTLPWSFAGAGQYKISQRATVNAQVEYSTWSDMSSELESVGGTGSNNALRAALGVELATNHLNPAKFPLRLGVRSAQLPFPLAAGAHPKETAVSTGTGFRFGKGRAAADFALQRVWRSEDGGFSEKAWILTMGVTLKP